MSSFLLVRLPSHPKSVEVVDFMQKNHFSYRITSNFNRFFNSILGDSRLSAAIDFKGESECGFEEKHLLEQLIKIYGTVEVKEEDPDVDDDQAKGNVDEQLAEKIKQEDQPLEVPLSTLKNDGAFDEDQHKEVKEEEPDDYEPSEERIRNLKTQKVSPPVEIGNVDEHGEEGDREAKEDPIYTNSMVENASSEEIDVGPVASMTPYHEDPPFEYAQMGDDEEEEELIEEEERQDGEENEEMDTEEEDAELEKEDEEEEESEDSEEGSEYEEEDEKSNGNAHRHALKAIDAAGRQLFTCPVKDCPSSHKSFEELKEHMKSHSVEENYFCDVCKKEFSSLFVALDHIRKRKEKECCQCGKKNPTLWKMVEHHRIHTGERPFICGHCKKTFTNKCTLKVHEIAHSGEKPFECDQCSRKFSQRSSLTRHLQTHTGSKPYECGECKKRYARKTHLKEHEMTHSGIKPHECSQCKKRFITRNELTRHMRIHTGDKPFECGDCKKRFRQSGSLKSHELTHSGMKPYECSQCDKKFTTSSQLTNHSRTHTGFKSYECGQCGEKFMWRNSLSQHMKTKHK